MGKDHRIIDSSGTAIPFTCQNRGFQTKVTNGFPHAPASTRGSVFPNALVSASGVTLWLEHVEARSFSEDFYWFMWYDPQGNPTIPMSSVFGKAELRSMVAQLVGFVP